jgi:chromosome segregation ATPase
MASTTHRRMASAESFFRNLQDLSRSPDCHEIVSIIDRNTELEKINEDLKTANKCNLDNITCLNNEIQGLNSLRDEVARLTTRVQDLKGTIKLMTRQIDTAELSLADVNKARAGLETERADLEKQLVDLTRASDEQVQDLSELRSKALELSAGVPDSV